MENRERNGAQNGEKSMALSFSICGILGLEAAPQVTHDAKRERSLSEPSTANESSDTIRKYEDDNEEGNVLRS